MDEELVVLPLQKEDVPELWSNIEKSDKVMPKIIGMKDLVKGGLENGRLLFFSFILKKKTDRSEMGKVSEQIVGYAICTYHFSSLAGLFIQVSDMMIFGNEKDHTGCVLLLVKQLKEISLKEKIPYVEFYTIPDSVNHSVLVNSAGAVPPVPNWLIFRFPSSAMTALSCSVKLPNEQFCISHVTKTDISLVYELMQHHAEEDNALEELHISVKDLENYLSKGSMKILVVKKKSLTVESCVESRNPVIVGMAMYYMSFCPFVGNIVRLEDLYIDIPYRSQGLGTELIKVVAKAGSSSMCKEMSLEVADQNIKAIHLYTRLGGEIINKCVMQIRF